MNTNMLEIRRDTDGKVDEVVFTDKHGKCVLRIERVDGVSWWAGVYPNESFGSDESLGASWQGGDLQVWDREVYGN